MAKRILRRILWLGRGTATMMGLALILALMLGVATTALAAVPGDPFKLGKSNAINAVSSLVGSVDNAMLKVINTNTGSSATALDLRVKPGKAPMKVNSGTKVANLNSEEVDGKSADEIGVNGLGRFSSTSAFNSDSSKTVNAICPVGKVLVGTGYDIVDGKGGSFPNQETDIVIDDIIPQPQSPFPTFVRVDAFEEEPTSTDWSVTAYAICATAP